MIYKTCPWTKNNTLLIDYHDKEWGVPIYDDAKLFEFIILDTFQAGLSWAVILNKRENFRRAFDNFDFEKIAGYHQKKLELLLNNDGIIRNKLKIMAAVSNARAFINIRKECGSFSKFIWSFVDGKAVHNTWKSPDEIPVKTEKSDKMSQELVKRGFKFTGSTICYAFMQASGMVNDHLLTCFRYKQIIKLQK